jgi:D-alanyl-D-alanine-carboxypeptidase/D-alanyl-D-alanine-endopeptidase
MIATMRRHKRMSALLVLVLFAAGATAIRGEDAKPAIPDDVKANIQARIDAHETAGVVVGLVGPGGETYHSAGWLQAGKPEPVDPDTIFEIGSITKTFTGILLADMVRRGEVKLDDPVRKYLPATVKLPKDGDREITLVDLATQRSGLPRLPDNMKPADPDDPYVDYTVERLYAFLAVAKLEHPTGSTYGYSNLGMGLLGHALSLAAKTDYNTLVRQRVATPLGMAVTSIQVDPAATRRVAQGYANESGKLAPAAPWTWRPTSFLAGAGGLRSSAREMIRYVAANAGLTESKLSPAMADSHVERADAGSAQMGIGLAWHLRKGEGRVIVWHNGGTGGFHSFCGFDPKTKTGVVVLSSSSGDVDDIGIHLLDPTTPLREIDKTVVVDEAKLARLDGWYDLGGPKIRITHEGTQLFAQLTGQERYPVFAKSSTLFVYRVVPAILEFDVQADGTVTEVTLHQGGRDMPAKRLSADAAPKERVEVPVDPKLLSEYVGRYELAPGVVLEVRLKDGHLSCQLTGQQAFDAYGESATTFFLKVVDAQLTFGRNAAGKVDSVTLHQGGVDQRAARTGS